MPLTSKELRQICKWLRERISPFDFGWKSPKGPIVYFLVFWATHPLAQKIFPEVTRYAYRHRDEDVIRRWVQMEARVRALGRKGKDITEWS